MQGARSRGKKEEGMEASRHAIPGVAVHPEAVPQFQ